MPKVHYHHVPISQLVPDSLPDRKQSLLSKGDQFWNRPDWKVYHRKGVFSIEKLMVEGDPIPLLRAHASLNSSVNEVADYVILNKAAQVDWDPTVDQVIEWAAEGDHRVFQIPCDTGRIPFLPDRDFVYYEGYQHAPDGSLYSVAESIEANEIPALGNSIRGRLCYIMRNVIWLGYDACRLEIIWQTDMAGRLPINQVTSGSAKSLANEFVHFQEKFGIFSA
ncbi:MAG: START domain-containing protein [Bacteroidota bacterium]